MYTFNERLLKRDYQEVKRYIDNKDYTEATYALLVLGRHLYHNENALFTMAMNYRSKGHFKRMLKAAKFRVLQLGVKPMIIYIKVLDAIKERKLRKRV